ncbi:MAG: undecaprenyl-diphosphate phosphatase [Acholeplasmataceae bacterium]|nr:undecaprenyl-diphosphate phosphatase [Acholeplasmataceae bacterium]
MLEIIKYIILGIIQGITEIFPISSSGHLVIFSHLLGLNLEHLSIFLMITNTGSFLALVIFFRQDLKQLLVGTYRFVIKREQNFKQDFEYVLKLLVAIIPLGIAAFFFKNHLPDDLLTIGFALIITAGLLFYIYKIRDIQWKKELSWKNALVIGAFQMFAFVPGISRSGMALSGGLSQKIELKKIVKFSFLAYIFISIPVMIVGFYNAYHASESIHIVGYSLAFMMSFIFSFFTIHVLYHFIKVKNLLYFSLYCLLIGGLSIVLYFL